MADDSIPMTAATPNFPSVVIPSPATAKGGIDLSNAKPIGENEDLSATFWPEDETSEEFANTIRSWRQQSA
jgi:hypothetical protein